MHVLPVLILLSLILTVSAFAFEKIFDDSDSLGVEDNPAHAYEPPLSTKCPKSLFKYG